MSSNRPLRPLLSLAALVAASAGLGACVTDRPPPAALAAAEPLDQYPMRVTRTPDDLALAAHPGGLSPAQRHALAAFAERWRAAGEGPIVVSAPTQAPDAALAGRIAHEAVDSLAALGVPHRAVRLVGYSAGGRPGAPVLASFDRLAADIPNCADKWGNLTSTAGNRVNDSFGCSVHANMSAQISNPRDILEPVPLEPGDASRRMVVLGKYREGKITASDRDSQAKGTLAKAVAE